MKKFWSKVEVGGPDECWNWIAAKTRAGYGVIRLDGQFRYAHRLSYEVASGEILPGNFILHSCDNPACVNPAHLRQGTQLDNMADMVSRGRQGRNGRGLPGEQSGRSKLKNEQVFEIRRLLGVGEKQRDIAVKFQIDQSLVSDIKNKHAWAHLS